MLSRYSFILKKGVFLSRNCEFDSHIKIHENDNEQCSRCNFASGEYNIANCTPQIEILSTSTPPQMHNLESKKKMN